MTRRLLAAAAFVVATLAALVPAAAQGGEYSGGWTDPARSGTRDGQPLAYLDSQRDLVGQVSHPNGIQNVAIVLRSTEVPEGCEAVGDANGSANEGTGQSVIFRFTAQFPCNLVYEVRATAQAAASGGLSSSTPEPYHMPLLVAVAIPPQPVAQVDAILEVDGDDPSVTLRWPANAEPDLLGYVVTRVVDGERETLGQVDVEGKREWLDDDPPTGETATYEVSAVRSGPDDDVKQVAAPPTAVAVDVPGEPEDDEDEGGGDGDGDGSADGDDAGDDGAPLGSSSSNDGGGGGSDPGALSSVRQRGGGGPPRTSPTTIDTGFGETLPFDTSQQPPGEVAAPAGDGSVVAEFEFEKTSPFANRETMAMIAGGLALLVGSLVIVYVTRRAATIPY